MIYINSKRAIAITHILYIMLSYILMLLIDAFIAPSYWVKSFIKIVFFFIVPAIIMYGNKENREEPILKVDFKKIKVPLILGLAVFCIIIIGYNIGGFFYDFEKTANVLHKTGVVNENNFLFVAFYIMFINSFIEEFFFRGFAFLNLNKYTNKYVTYIFSSFSFAIYHLAMLWNWFALWIYILIICSLALAGAIFDFLCQKYNNIYPSWIVHFFANLSINLIGLFLLDIV